MLKRAIKTFRSPEYNYVFSPKNGLFMRWGKTFDDDPQYSPYGPEILDIEISTGDCTTDCQWCYKNNTNEPGVHMTLETFKRILAKMPTTLTQIAFGITDANANPDFVKILKHTRDNGVVPNYTTSGQGMTNDIIDATIKHCGAVAVSVYPHTKDLARYIVERILWRQANIGDSGTLAQVNLHLLYHEDNIPFVIGVMKDIANGDFDGYGAVVLLGLKPKGRGESMKPAGYDQFEYIVKTALANDVRFGFDSCSAHDYIRFAKENSLEHTLYMAEPCEASLFSLYIDVDGNAWPCSFAENMPGIKPVPILEEPGISSVWNSIWNSRPIRSFRHELLGCGRNCPLF